MRAQADKERYRKQKEVFRPRPQYPVEEPIDKSKRKKHPLAPKHPLSAYLFYVATNRSALNAKFPEKDFTAIAQILGRQWKDLPSTAKRKYEILAFADKKRYEEEKDKWVPPAEQKNTKKQLIKSRKSITAYSFWAQDERQKLASMHPNLGRKHLTKVLRQRWKLIPPQDKAPYLEQADRDRDRAEKEALLENPDMGMGGLHLEAGMPTVDAIQNVIEASKLQSWNAHELAQFVSLLGNAQKKSRAVCVLRSFCACASAAITGRPHGA
jgi:hypothetical protein